MPELEFSVTGVRSAPYTSTPTLLFDLRVVETSGVRIDTIDLHAQVQIEATRRAYAPRERAALRDLFGIPERWGRTLRTMLWTHADLAVPGFDGETSVAVPVACTHDLSVAATRYFHALEGAPIPLAFQFSGTVFHRDADGDLQIAPVPWTAEARYQLDAAAWHALMDEHYPGSAWLCLPRDLVERLHVYRMENDLPTIEAALDALIPTVVEVGS